jgi:hypothetical protein
LTEPAPCQNPSQSTIRRARNTSRCPKTTTLVSKSRTTAATTKRIILAQRRKSGIISRTKSIPPTPPLGLDCHPSTGPSPLRHPVLRLFGANPRIASPFASRRPAIDRPVDTEEYENHGSATAGLSLSTPTNWTATTTGRATPGPLPRTTQTSNGRISHPHQPVALRQAPSQLTLLMDLTPLLVECPLLLVN